MRITHSTPITEFIDLGLCNSASDKDFAFVHASRLKRLLLGRGWHETDEIPQIELTRLVNLALNPAPEIDHEYDTHGLSDDVCMEVVDEADEGVTRCERPEEEHAR